MNWNWTETEKCFLFVTELKAIETISLFSQNINDIEITHTHTQKKWEGWMKLFSWAHWISTHVCLIC